MLLDAMVAVVLPSSSSGSSAAGRDARSRKGIYAFRTGFSSSTSLSP